MAVYALGFFGGEACVARGSRKRSTMKTGSSSYNAWASHWPRGAIPPPRARFARCSAPPSLTRPSRRRGPAKITHEDRGHPTRSGCTLSSDRPQRRRKRLPWFSCPFVPRWPRRACRIWWESANNALGDHSRGSARPGRAQVAVEPQRNAAPVLDMLACPPTLHTAPAVSGCLHRRQSWGMFEGFLTISQPASCSHCRIVQHRRSDVLPAIDTTTTPARLSATEFTSLPPFSLAT